jgi:hypothetical protein
MSLQSERLLAQMRRLRFVVSARLLREPAETAAAKNLSYLDFLEELLEAESSAKHARNVWLKEAVGALSLQQGAGAVRL